MVKKKKKASFCGHLHLGCLPLSQSLAAQYGGKRPLCRPRCPHLCKKVTGKHGIRSCRTRFVHSLGYEAAGGWARSSHGDWEGPEAGQLLAARAVAHPSFCKVQYVHKLQKVLWFGLNPRLVWSLGVVWMRGWTWKDALNCLWQLLFKIKYLSQPPLFPFSSSSWTAFTWGNISEDTFFCFATYWSGTASIC